MICRLCLKDEQCIINIFTDLGITLNAAEILAKYFWFEPKPDDPISTSICENCWNKVSDFNEFYLSVEEAHRLLTERFSINFNINKPMKSQTFTTKSVTTNENAVLTTTPTKQDNAHDDTPNVKTPTAAEIITPNEASQNVNELTIRHNIDNVAGIEVANYEDSTYLTLSDVNEWDEDALQETEISDIFETTKRITRNTLKVKETSLSNSANELRISPKAAEKKERIKRGRGRPRKSLTKTTNLTQSVSEIILKKEATSPELSQKTQLNKDQQPKKYKARVLKGDERIAQFSRLICDVCNEKQETFTDLCKHMMSLHKQRGFVICCGKKFYKRVMLLDHVEKHLNPDLFSCKECDKTFADKQCLRNHITIKHLPEESKTFSCEYCHKKFAKTYLLEQHEKMHKERNHICEVCRKGFPSANQLKAHIKVIHNNYGTMCDICAKVIRGRAAFSRHVLQHQGIELPKVQCPQCGSWHKDKYGLQKHIRRHNIDGTQHVCNECGKVAPNRSALMSHQRFVHKAERSYECGVCKKAFKKQISLKEHMAMHTGEALYNCPYCTRTFNSNANMHSHRKKIHPKEFEEARMKRQIQVSLNKNYESRESAQVEEEQNPTLQLDVDNSNIINLDENDVEETHLLMSTDKFGEFIFKVDSN